MSEDKQLFEDIDEDLLGVEPFSVYIVEQDKIISKYETPVELINPFEFDASRFLPNRKPMDLNRFYELASSLIKKAQNMDSVSENKKVHLVEEYPPLPFDDFGDEVIVFRLLRREPALMNAKGTGRPQRKSNYYYDIVKPNYPNKVIVVESRPIDHVIEFACWAKSNKLANQRALWLEKLFVNYSWVWETQGVERFYFKDRGPDTYMTSGNQRLFYRPINFFVRFREFEVKAHTKLREIEFDVGT